MMNDLNLVSKLEGFDPEIFIFILVIMINFTEEIAKLVKILHFDYNDCLMEKISDRIEDYFKNNSITYLLIKN